METLSPPAFDLAYQTFDGQHFFVIGVGTQGIIIEYHDGRVELVPQVHWQNLATLSRADN